MLHVAAFTLRKEPRTTHWMGGIVHYIVSSINYIFPGAQTTDTKGRHKSKKSDKLADVADKI